MSEDPTMPSFNESIPDPVEGADPNQESGNEPPESDEGGQKPNNPDDNPYNPNDGEEGVEGEEGKDDDSKAHKSDEEAGETPDEEHQKEVEGIIGGWKEDRVELTKLRNENYELKEKFSKIQQKEDEEEYEGLSDNERVNRIIEKRDASSIAKQEQEDKDVADEVRFYERSSKEFRDNKEAIMKVATEFNASSLEQAIKIWSAHNTATKRVEGTKKYNEKRKKDAGSDAGGGAGKGNKAKSKYNPEVDGKKSFGDLYSEGL